MPKHSTSPFTRGGKEIKNILDCYKFVSIKILELVNSGKITETKRGHILSISEAALSQLEGLEHPEPKPHLITSLLHPANNNLANGR